MDIEHPWLPRLDFAPDGILTPHEPQAESEKDDPEEARFP
jgi:hypothetical protein